MPLSTIIITQCQSLVNEVMNSAIFRSTGDFDVFQYEINLLFSGAETIPIKMSYLDEFIRFSNLLDGFDLYLTEKILSLDHYEVAGDDPCKRRRIPAFTSAAPTEEEKLQEVKSEYREIILAEIKRALAELPKKTVERRAYIKAQNELIAKKKAAQQVIKQAVLNPLNIQITDDENALLIQLRNYLYVLDEEKQDSGLTHAERASFIFEPGMYVMSNALREYEFNHLMLSLDAHVWRAESIFRMIEIFPGYRSEIYNKLKARIDELCHESSRYKNWMMAVFPDQFMARAIPASPSAEAKEDSSSENSDSDSMSMDDLANLGSMGSSSPQSVTSSSSPQSSLSLQTSSFRLFSPSAGSPSTQRQNTQPTTPVTVIRRNGGV